MAVKYNKSRGTFDVRHYEDLTNKEIVKGVNDIDINDKKLDTLKLDYEKAQFELKRIKAEIDDLENYQDVVGRVTHIYNGVPVMQSLTVPEEDNICSGRFAFSGSGDYKARKHLEAWTNAHLDKEVLLSSEDIWCFRIKDGSDKEDTFLPHQYEETADKGGFSLDFIKMIAYEYVVNDRPNTDFYRNLDKWFKMHERDKSLKDLLES